MVNNKTITYRLDLESISSTKIAHYYLKFPKDEFWKNNPSYGSSPVDLTREYSFFFPEKPFVLIKYIPIKCPEVKND